MNTSSSEIGRFSQNVDMHSAFAQAVRQSVSEIDIHASKVSHGPFNDECRGVTQTRNHVLHHSLSGWFIKSLLPEGTGLTKIILIHGIVAIHSSAHVEWRRTSGWTFLRSRKAVWIIIRCATLIVHRHATIPLVMHCGNRLKNQYLQLRNLYI